MKATIYHPGQHLAECDTYPVGDYCPICNQKAHRSESVHIQDAPEIKLLTCCFCKGSFSSYLPLQNVLDAYYENYYSDNPVTVTFHDPVRFARHILKPMDFAGRKEISILDFGGGGGDISYAAARELIDEFPDTKVSIVVVDYETPKNIVEDNLVFKSVKGLDEIEGESYDLIIASAVLEHVPNLYNIVTVLFSMVNKDGYFYARTPYMEPLMRLSKSIDMTYPAHIYDLGGYYWNSVIETYNLQAIKVRSRPSIVETGFNQSFFRALIAYLLKVPGYIETSLFPQKKKIYWQWVGGWEIYLKFSSRTLKK